MNSLIRIYIRSLLLATNVLASVVSESLYTKYKRGDTDFEWGAISDSWATGVRAKDADDYNPGSTDCLRTNYAYAPQLETDTSWTGGKQENFQFAACSGARLVDMVHGQQQIVNTNEPRLVTMTAGGNNAGFFNIASNCIYQQRDDVDYGPEFADDPNNGGLCSQAIISSTKYLNGTDGSLALDLNNTIHDIVISPQFTVYPDTFLYLTGYAHFFAVDDTWCDNWSFGAYPARRPKVTLKLRQSINALTESLNNIYKQTIDDFPAKNLRYISITEGFNGHRFCESKPAWTPDVWWYNRQYYGSDYTWIWNLSSNVTDGLNPSTLTNEVATPPPGFTGEMFTFTESPPGWQQRPFHPKAQGYTAIKDAIIAQMKIDQIPAAQGSSASPKGPVATQCIAKGYDTFDDCSASCLDGTCNENAGQAQIQCVC